MEPNIGQPPRAHAHRQCPAAPALDRRRGAGPTAVTSHGFQRHLLAAEIAIAIYGIFILGFERTQQPGGLACCRLRHIDAKIRPHHRAKYGRGGSGISRVTTLTVSPIWIFWRG